MVDRAILVPGGNGPVLGPVEVGVLGELSDVVGVVAVVAVVLGFSGSNRF